jgi:tetratricopeptide (TPR) repeat protein
LIGDARQAVHFAIARSHLPRAWQLLQEYDGDGNAKGAVPYTDGALAELGAAYDYDPDNVNIAHHLAIAHHARAWDMELQDDPRAAGAWELALGYWRTVGASGGFWAGLREKLRSCDGDADASVLDKARQNLLENLLEIHVDFVRYYCESDTPGRATSHVELVRRAAIPPAVKKRLVDKVFSAMTGRVPEARAMQAYASSLTTVEQFLSLFPNHLPALRLHSEVCAEWAATLSYKEDWEEVLKLSARAGGYAKRLEAHPELGNDPLALKALDDLANEFVERGCSRGESHLAALQGDEENISERDAAKHAFDLGIGWGRLARGRSPSGSSVRAMLGTCLQGRGSCVYLEAMEVMQTDMKFKTRATAAERLLRAAVADMEEARELSPDDDDLSEMLQMLYQHISNLESAMTTRELFGDLGDLL